MENKQLKANLEYRERARELMNSRAKHQGKKIFKNILGYDAKNVDDFFASQDLSEMFIESKLREAV
jgi:hypothetical protein